MNSIISFVLFLGNSVTGSIHGPTFSFLFLCHTFGDFSVLRLEMLVPKGVHTFVAEIFLECAVGLEKFNMFFYYCDIFVSDVSTEVPFEPSSILFVEVHVGFGVMHFQVFNSFVSLSVLVQVRLRWCNLWDVRLEIGSDGHHQRMKLEVTFTTQGIGVPFLVLLDNLKIIAINIGIVLKLLFGLL